MNVIVNLLPGETSFRTLTANVAFLECSLVGCDVTQAQGIMLQGSGDYLCRDCTTVVGSA
jgi:hypothetical protein